MKSSVGHLEICIETKNMGFYKDLFKFLGWTTLYEEPSVLGVGGENGCSLWFGPRKKEIANDYDGTGVNHIGIGVPAQGDVDLAVAYLKDIGVPALFDTPRHRPEFSGEGITYYQVMFESPDRILFEIVYTGPKA